MKFFLTLVFVLITMNTYSQCNQGLSLFLGGGSSFSSQIKNDYDPSYNLDLNIGYKICEHSMFRFGYQYIRFVDKHKTTTTFDEIGNIGKLTTNIIKVNFLYGEFRSIRTIHWYLSGGGGLYYVGVDKKVNSNRVYESQSNIGINGGAGISFGLSENNQFRIFVEGQAHNIFAPGATFKTFFPIVVGLNYDFFD